MAAFSVDSLPLGFRFRPTDVELVNHYLKGKIRGRIKSEVEVIPVIDVCKCDPWDLPAKALIKSSDEWFFFSPKDRKYPNSGRSNRTTLSGYWKATGKDRTIKARARDTAIIGTKKTLVFYQGRAPKGVRTNWIMHEYRTTEPELDSGKQGGFVLYRLFKKMEEKTGEKTPVSEVDDCLERNIDDTHSSALSSSSTMLSPDGMLNGEVSTGEPVTSLDQKALLCDWQENIQHLPLPSDEQLSGVGELFSDKNNFTINNLPIQEEIHFTGAVASPASGVEFSLDNLAQFDFREFEHEFYDSVEKFVAESKPCQNLEDDYVTEFLDEILCDPEERSPDVSNDCSTLFPCYSYSPSEAFLFRDNTTGIGGDDNTDVPEILEHHEENTESSLDSSINAKKELSHGNAISTVKTSSPLEFGDAEKSDGLRSRRAHNDEIEKKTSDQSLDALAISSGSYSVIRIILILSALLFLLCLGLSWCLSC
ncbi:protein NTM1-like 9 isoform X2 [Zingiber officinale]|uniref:protein NTM1-like 9 isoform X2 n=1 Tax=Zingiber officinale TaxID=94328 RepID=UPI001C4B902F|nr:protein NTM1-like 9 isoform X2 [Zingiber officinale]